MEIALGLGVPILFAICAWVLTVDRGIRHIRRVADASLKKLQNPVDSGFGTAGLTKALEENTAALISLTDMTRWYIEGQIEERIPPFGRKLK